MSLPGVQTPEQAAVADLEDAFARTTIELCELRASHGERLEYLLEAIEHADMAHRHFSVPLPRGYEQWKKATEIG